jgi:hypothetical protein
MGQSRKHPYLPHRGNWKLTPLPPSDILIHLLLSETNFCSLPHRMAEVSSSGVTLYQGAPGSKFSKAPLVEVLKARVEHRIYAQVF